MESMSNSCEHYPILDQSSGTEVCTNCGLVLSENLLYDEIHFNVKDVRNIDNLKQVNNMLVDGADNVPLFIRTVGDKINLCNESIENAINKFKTLFEKYDGMKFGGKRRRRKICTNLNIAVYAIYNTLKKEGNPRPLKEICYAAGVVSMHEVWKLEKYFAKSNENHFTRSSQTGVLTAKDLLYSHYSLLDLDFNDVNEIIRIIELLPSGNGCTPTTTIASLVYIYLNKIKNNKFPMTKITELFQTSSMSIHRFMKRNSEFIDGLLIPSN